MTPALCFDMFGTICDTTSVDSRVRERVDAPAGLIDDLVALWREKQLQYTYLRSLMDAYEPFSVVTDAALTYATDYYGIDLRATDRDAILGAYEELAAFEDAKETIDALASTERPLAILSNGDPGLLEPLAENVGLADSFDAIVSADQVRSFKPDPAVYAAAADRLDRPIGECMLVSANGWDVAGAAEAGMQTAWVNRANDPVERVGGTADVTVEDLTELLAEVG